jgi:hypothetical protein
MPGTILAHIVKNGCNVSPSPTDVSPTENSWMLHSLDKVSLIYCAPARTIPSLNNARHSWCGPYVATRKEGTRHPCVVRPMRDAVQGWDTSVRGTISKGRFVQGAQHPRTFNWGHIGRGHINPASKNAYSMDTMDTGEIHILFCILFYSICVLWSPYL